MGRAFPPVTVLMKLPELKQRVRSLWNSINTWNGEVMSGKSFEQDVKVFGDRRYKETWVKALCRYEACLTHKSCLDSWALITISLNFTPDRYDYEYRHQILDEFLMYPDALTLIKSGLEDLFGSDFSPREREEADGFYNLVAEREGQHRGIDISIRLARAITGTRAAA
ncbi:MAG: hypothetical protein AAF329_05945 [Cyanobacteria bacterium P01_A01_bin.17]